MEGMMPPDGYWFDYAMYNVEYAHWLAKVDELTTALLDIQLKDLLETTDLDPYEAYYTDRVKPEVFFVDAIIPFIENEHGYDYVHEHVYENMMWGQRAEPRL